MTMTLLVVDGYAREGRRELADCGIATATDLWARTLRRLWPGVAVETLFAADADAAPPRGAALADFAGVVWTGSSLTIHSGRPEVVRQIDFARAVFAAGVPQFGACWGLQIAVMAAGGDCGPNPAGREIGLARKIRLTAAGRGHPMYTGKPDVFDAWAVHDDMATRLPPGAVLLAENAFTPVQAVDIRHGPGLFWAVQYHPEFDAREMALHMRCRRRRLVALGLFETEEAVADYAAGLMRLHEHPHDRALRFLHAADDDALDDALRTLEVANWLRHAALPRHLARA